MYFSELTIKPATAGDFEFYYMLKCEQENIYWSGFRSAPEKDSLHMWFMHKLEYTGTRDNYRLYIISASIGQLIVKVGYLSIHKSDRCENGCEISIGIAEAFMGRGMGTRAIQAAADECGRIGWQQVLAYIRKDNARSHAAFTKAGFIWTGKIRMTYIDNMNSYLEMWEYKCEKQVSGLQK